jgi:invasion protein IalB
MWGGRQIKAYVGGGTAGAAESLASATTIHTFTMGQRCRPIAAGIMVTTIGTVQSAIVTFTSTGGSAGDCGKVTVPTTVAAAYGVYEVSDYNVIGTSRWVATLKRGQQVVVAVTQANTGGAGIPILIVEEDPDVFANETPWSATVNA